MAKTITVEVSVPPTKVVLQREDYRDEYDEKCEQDGDEPAAEVPDEFILAEYQKDLDDGNTDLAEVFEAVPVTVTVVA